MAAFWSVTETDDTSLINMELVNHEVNFKAASKGICCSPMYPSQISVKVMHSTRALREGEKLYVKHWKPVTCAKRKGDDDDLEGEPVTKKAKGRGKKGRGKAA